jgi:hypothetical protein
MKLNRSVIRCLLLAIGTLVFVITSVPAQPPGNTSIRLEVAYGTQFVGDTIYLSFDSQARFYIIYFNRDSVRYNISNGFVVYSSADGLPGTPRGSGTANWSFPISNGGNYDFTQSPTTGIWVDTTGFYSLADFGGGFKLDCFNCDGSGIDTVIFAASVSDPSQRGAHASDSGIGFAISVKLKVADTCKFVCFDSINATATQNTWKWSSVNFTPEYDAVPTWSGARCFKLKTQKNCRFCKPSACCTGYTGNVDCDPENRVDISDLTRLIDYEYIGLGPLCCPQAANIDGDDWGGVDISDITRLINYLYIDFWWPAPCATQGGGC